MATSNGSFAASVLANKLKIEMEINKKCYEISRELFLQIVELTPTKVGPVVGPYAKGVLANNWFPVDGAGYSADKTDSKVGKGQDSINRINALKGTQFFRQDGTVTLSNNIPYAFRAEYVGWPESDNPRWKNARPYFMVSTSLLLIAGKYRK
jgi:hypothetical protein